MKQPKRCHFLEEHNPSDQEAGAYAPGLWARGAPLKMNCMKIKAMIVFALAIQSVSAFGEPRGEMETIVGKQWEMGVELLRRDTDHAQRVFSPYSVHSGLALARLGAHEKTASELDSLLFGGASADLFSAYGRLNREIEGEGSGAACSVANSVWVSDRGEILPSYQKAVVESLSAEARSITSAHPEKAIEAINSWVSSKTHSRIANLLSPGSVDSDTSVVLVNALYFRGKWIYSFEKRDTTQEDFWLESKKSIQVPMMHGAHSLAYFESSDWHGALLPYQGESYGFALLVPRERLSTSELATKISPSLLRQVVGSSQYVEVELSMPRFSIRQRRDLAKSIAALGVPSAFSADANFSGISTLPALISAIVHESFVETDEEGTEAAAATAVIMPLGAMPHEGSVKQLRADRPFVFAIVHLSSGVPMFIGIVGDPR